MPDFLKEADRFARFVRIAENEGDVDTALFEQAERHARLLQQVWEWATSPTEDQAAWHAEAPETARIALDGAKAFVRSCLLETPLLAGEPEEPTR